MSNSIILEADDDSFQRESGIATGTITPGNLIEFQGLDTSGGSTEVQVARSASDGAVAVPRIALEMAKTGKTVTDDYSTDDYVEWKVAQSGEEYQILVFDGDNAAASGADVSTNANISAGDYLVPYAGGGEDGTFRAYDSGNGDTEGLKMFQATESVDNSAGTAPALIEVEKV